MIHCVRTFCGKFTWEWHRLGKMHNGFLHCIIFMQMIVQNRKMQNSEAESGNNEVREWDCGF